MITEKVMKNYQKIELVYSCLALYDEEPKCIGYSSGSHGDCRFRGTGSLYRNCSNRTVNEKITATASPNQSVNFSDITGLPTP